MGRSGRREDGEGCRPHPLPTLRDGGYLQRVAGGGREASEAVREGGTSVQRVEPERDGEMERGTRERGTREESLVGIYTSTCCTEVLTGILQ